MINWCARTPIDDFLNFVFGTKSIFAHYNRESLNVVILYSLQQF